MISQWIRFNLDKYLWDLNKTRILVYPSDTKIILKLDRKILIEFEMVMAFSI